MRNYVSYNEMHAADSSRLAQELVSLVLKHRWVFEVQVTKFFSKRWWEKIPEKWRSTLRSLSCEQLNDIPFGVCEPDWPSSLCSFITSCNRLSLPRSAPHWVQHASVTVEGEVGRGVSIKKKHEVSRLAGVVQEVCSKTDCQVVLDVGSGLGYLGCCLSARCGVRVVGVERERERVEGASRRAMESSRVSRQLEASSHVSVELTVDGSEESKQRLTSLLRAVTGPDGSGVCVVGLHCCGELTPDTLRFFSSLSFPHPSPSHPSSPHPSPSHFSPPHPSPSHPSPPHPSLNSLILLGCCYHKMTCCHENNEGADDGCHGDLGAEEFSSFPMSEGVRSALVEGEGVEAIGVFGMRLAAQETRERWHCQSPSQHRTHTNRVAFRAVLQCVLEERGLAVPARGVLRGLDCSSFEVYASQVSSNMEDPSLEGDLLRWYSHYSQFIDFIEPFTALQVCMQGVLESLVLLDRCLYLREKGIWTELLPIFNEGISPRNVAIIAARKPLW